MKNIYHFTLVVFALAGLLSCNKMDDDALPVELIGFRQADMVSSFSATVQTKATVVDDSALASSGFYVTCTTGSAGSESNVWNSVLFTKNGSYYVAGNPGKWWPATNPDYHFYAANSAITFDRDGPTVSVTNTKDVVCAYMPSPTYMAANTLQFEHIFARITDVKCISTGAYTIDGISVTITPKTGGTYNLMKGAGKTDGTGWSSLTTGSPVSIANATLSTTKRNDIYLVPGTYTLTASWNARKGEYEKSFNKTVDITVVGGKRNILTASLTGDATDVVFNVSVAEWVMNKIVIGTFPTDSEN